MGKLQPISKRDRNKGVTITIGVDGRMYLSQGFKEAIEHTEKSSYYLFYDQSENRLGISKQAADDNIEPFIFSARGEGNVVSFIEDCEIQIPGKPILWLYECKEDGVYVFYQKGRHRTSFAQAKNGDLERVN